VGRGSVIVLAVFMALQEIGVATNIVTIAFGILFGAVALALGLAFGLGNRELAAEITGNWYRRYQAERAAMEREAAADEAEDFPETQEFARATPDVDAAEDGSEARP